MRAMIGMPNRSTTTTEPSVPAERTSLRGQLGKNPLVRRPGPSAQPQRVFSSLNLSQLAAVKSTGQLGKRRAGNPVRIPARTTKDASQSPLLDGTTHSHSTANTLCRPVLSPRGFPALHAPGRTRTSNLLVRSQLLYPIELRALRSAHPTFSLPMGQLAGRHTRRTTPSLDGGMMAVESCANHRYDTRAASLSLRGSSHEGNAASVRMSAWAEAHGSIRWWV